MPSPTRDDAAGPAVPDRTARLLDAQVTWVLDELTGDALADTVAADVGRVLEVAGRLSLGDVVAVADVQEIARRLVVEVTGSEVVESIAVPEALAVRRTLAADTTLLGDVVDRDDVEALVSRVVRMHTVRDHVLDHLAESPAAVQLTARLVGRIVADVLSQNRARAEKLPGMSSLLSLGTGAVSRVGKVGVGDFQLDRLVGDAMGAGAQYTMRRTTTIVRELVTDDALQQAAMELWDLQAAEPVGQLAGVVTEEDLTDLVGRVRDLVTGVRDTETAARIVDACGATFFETHAETDLASLLAGLGLTEDRLTQDVRRLAGPVLEAARADGVLERVVRARLAPFWASPEVAELLA
ncbi:MAG: hypothetical protein JWR42_1863 [Marmoricola sp.]|nr:hypothetical protein [Marmoricola sp.]